MKSLIEDIVGRLSEATFFSELCFRGQEFAASKCDTKELADVLVWMETDGLIIQVKERNKAIPTDQGMFEKWFSKKVLDKGSSQIADTVLFLRDHPSVSVVNARGHSFTLGELASANMHKVIVFGSLNYEADQQRLPKMHVSRRSGPIHIIDAASFSNLLRWVVTPGELIQYLCFRQTILNENPETLTRTEKWLFGSFASWSSSGGSFELPSQQEGETIVDSLADDMSEVDLRRLFDDVGRWAAGKTNVRMFYRILIECGQLTRGMMREFKKRMLKCYNRLDKPVPDTIYRIVNADRDCVFVLGVMPSLTVEEVETACMNLTFIGKYEAKTSKAIGLFFTDFGDDDIGTTPVYVEYPWCYDPEMDSALKEFDVFKPLKSGRIEHYKDRGHGEASE